MKPIAQQQTSKWYPTRVNAEQDARPYDVFFHEQLTSTLLDQSPEFWRLSGCVQKLQYHFCHWPWQSFHVLAFTLAALFASIPTGLTVQLSADRGSFANSTRRKTRVVPQSKRCCQLFLSPRECWHKSRYDFHGCQTWQLGAGQICCIKLSSVSSQYQPSLITPSPASDTGS